MSTISVIGAGNMSRAMVSGLIAHGYDPQHICVSSPGILQRKNSFPHPIHFTSDNKKAVLHAETVVLAVKPFMLAAICRELSDTIQTKNPLIISVVTGVTTARIAEWLSMPQAMIVRAMPNVASAVGAGMTGLFPTQSVTDAQQSIAESFFRSLGAVLWLKKEDEIDWITAVSGSGPAYLFYFFEAMQQAAESFGFSTEAAKLLVSETALGAAKLVMETDNSFQKLRSFVTSEKGTTAAAISVLEKNHLQKIVSDAMTAALTRAKELSL